MESVWSKKDLKNLSPLLASNLRDVLKSVGIRFLSHIFLDILYSEQGIGKNL